MKIKFKYKVAQHTTVTHQAMRLAVNMLKQRRYENNFLLLHQPGNVGKVITKQQLAPDNFIHSKISDITIQTKFRNQMHDTSANMEAEKFPSAISCGQLYKIKLYELLLNH